MDLPPTLSWTDYASLTTVDLLDLLTLHHWSFEAELPSESSPRTSPIAPAPCNIPPLHNQALHMDVSSNSWALSPNHPLIHLALDAASHYKPKESPMSSTTSPTHPMDQNGTQPEDFRSPSNHHQALPRPNAPSPSIPSYVPDIPPAQAQLPGPPAASTPQQPCRDLAERYSKAGLDPVETDAAQPSRRTPDYICKFCGKVFGRYYNARRHQGSARCHCDGCGSQFARSDERLRHWVKKPSCRDIHAKVNCQPSKIANQPPRKRCKRTNGHRIQDP